MSMNFSGFDKEFFMDLHKIAQDIVQKMINKDCFSDAIFNEKNEAVIEHAMYLTNFMYKRENFYFEILNRNDSIYSKFIQTYRSLAYSTPNTYASDDECVNIIKSAETDIEKINMSFESEEDKKDTYLKYYKWLIEECADRLKPASIQYIEARINELCLSYTVTDEVKKIAKKNLHNVLPKVNLDFFIKANKVV